MTEARKAQLKEKGFFITQDRFITFVYNLSRHNNKGMCNKFIYKGEICTRTDSGTCRFAHVTSFQSLPACKEMLLKLG